jgi:hypothetical protein
MVCADNAYTDPPCRQAGECNVEQVVLEQHVVNHLQGKE